MSNILSKGALDQIEQAIKMFKLYMRFKTVGPSKMTTKEIMELIRSGMLMNGKKHSIDAPIMEAYLHTHEQMVDTTVAPRQVRDGALNFLERSMDRYAGKMADQMKTDILSTVENSLMPFQDRREEGKMIYQALADKNIHKKNMKDLLEGHVKNWEFRYRTIVNTELNRAANWGAMDAILHNNPTKQPEELYVFKQGNKPGHGACKYCAQFWYLGDGVTPRVYKLSELVANGSNIGRKAKDWLPTVDSTHPNESHLMSELTIGFGFKNGSLDFISDKHNEYNSQRGIS